MDRNHEAHSNTLKYNKKCQQVKVSPDYTVGVATWPLQDLILKQTKANITDRFTLGRYTRALYARGFLEYRPLWAYRIQDAFASS